MNFVFFTFGGKQLWEDLFFYQGWRIQRSVITGKYRLLDNLDIRRESGSLNKCRNAFIKFAEVFQLIKTAPKAVVFIHGFGGTKDMFGKLCQEFKAAGYTSVDINFPSLYRKFDSIVEQFDTLLKNLKGVKEINFVAYGFGGIVLRKLISKSWSWKNKMRIGRVVIINTPNRGAGWGESASHSPLWLKILGPSTMMYSSDFIDQIPDFPSDMDIGAITSWSPLGQKVLSILPKSWRNLFQNPKYNSTPNTKETIAVKSGKINPCCNDKLISYCINFIKSGKFVSAQKIKKL